MNFFSAILKRSFFFGFIFFVVAMVLWIDRTFGRPSLDQIHFHIRAWIVHPTTFNIASVIHFVVLEAGLSLLGGFFVAGAEKKICLCLESHFEKSRTLCNVIKRIPVFFFLLFLLYSFLLFDGHLYLYNHRYVSFLEKNNVQVNVVSNQSQRTKNLIHIYVESLDMALTDSNYFGQNLLSHLTAMNGVRFSKFQQALGTGWTIAGIASSQCGLPIRPEISLDPKQATMGHFDPVLNISNYVCLGNLLKKAGYHNVFMGGADSHFTNKLKYLLDHGYDEVYGLDDWKKKGIFKGSDMKNLGLSDQQLFEEAKKKLLELKQSNQHFQLTILTLDTHDPGEQSNECAIPYDPHFPISSKAKCTDQIVSSFVQWVQKNHLDQNTQIVIQGDHTGAFVYPPQGRQDRSIFNLFIPDQKNEEWKTCGDEILHFDFAPTILTFLGFEIPGQRMGIGVNLLCKDQVLQSSTNDPFLHQRKNFLKSLKSMIGDFDG